MVKVTELPVEEMIKFSLEDFISAAAVFVSFVVLENSSYCFFTTAATVSDLVGVWCGCDESTSDKTFAAKCNRSGEDNNNLFRELLAGFGDAKEDY
ncbi:hypothetical protein Patl1_05020 [Pistacia atlantica]|uniref:Uncharacterized protein n=1 Tax=Pistacia atlantica TaxID=434234 RepID=A0ACC1BV46_9ROSI|nr:hypothetical protein Patl1_05020 [Pistacia atlantica]